MFIKSNTKDKTDAASLIKEDVAYWSIRCETDGEGVEAEVLLYGEIGDSFWSEGVGAKKFAEELKAKGKLKHINVRINSPGGSVPEGLGIYNTLVRHPAAKTVYIDGMAASIASVICMAGDTVVMPANAIMMIHDPAALVIGDAEDMRKMANNLDKIKEGLISAYIRKTKLSRDDIWSLMTEETWMNADEAVEWGFADEVEEPMRMAAHFDLSHFQNTPQNILEQFSDRSGSRIRSIGLKKGRNYMDQHEKFLHRQESEKVRTTEILTIGERYNLITEAIEAVKNGTPIEEFRDFTLQELGKRNRPLGPLDRNMRTAAHVFNNLGEQLIAVYQAGLPGGKLDPRLDVVNAASGLGTTVPSEGGYLVQTDFSQALLDRTRQAAILAPKCWHVPIGPNADGLEMPNIEETSRATGSRWGGVQVYRRAEADIVTAKKPKFGSLELRLEDLMGLCFVTNRQLKDAPSTGAVISRAFEEEFAFRVDDEIIRGTGAGQCLGILNSPSLITVGKEMGQAADTIVYENLTAMWSRMPLRNRLKAEWYYNQEIEPQFFSLGITMGMGAAPVYMPPGGLSASPYATLLGRPLIPIEQASALGDLGDIIFADLSEYLLIEKDGLESEQSIHVRFLYDESVFRFIIRNNGMPLWKSPLTPYKGAKTLSPFVTLEAR
jgi:HK97 family phage major capsid protein/ATP-dependent Clp endopeptidase proteolytic subunit ClpP